MECNVSCDSFVLSKLKGLKRKLHFRISPCFFSFVPPCFWHALFFPVFHIISIRCHFIFTLKSFNFLLIHWCSYVPPFFPFVWVLLYMLFNSVSTHLLFSHIKGRPCFPISPPPSTIPLFLILFYFFLLPHLWFFKAILSIFNNVISTSSCYSVSLFKFPNQHQH